jgi:hypothetical protein
MSRTYDINQKLPQKPDQIWAVVKKKHPRADRKEYLVRPRYLYSGKNNHVRIAYPGFFAWLKFVDPDRKGDSLEKKVSEYDLAKSRYELQISEVLKQFREGKDGKKFATATAVMEQIDKQDGHLITIVPCPFDEIDDPGTHADDSFAPVDENASLLGIGSTIRISPEGCSQDPEDALVLDQSLLHELAHAMFTSDSNDDDHHPHMKDFDSDHEFYAIQIENVYRSEKGLTKVRGAHDTKTFWSSTDSLFKKPISPPPERLISQLEIDEPDLCNNLALIPEPKAKYNPFREHNTMKKSRKPDPASP